MAVKLIETKLYNKRIDENILKDFLKGFGYGVKNQVYKQLGIATFEDWLKDRGLKQVELAGIKSGIVYKGRTPDSGDIYLFINRNDDKKIYFELDDITLTLDFMNLIYRDWSNKDVKAINTVAKKLNLEIIERFDSWVYQALAGFLYQYHLNIFMVEWKTNEKYAFNNAVETGNFNNTELNTLLVTKSCEVLEKSKISDKELLSILGYKPKGDNASRYSICYTILYNIVKAAKKGAKIKGTKVLKHKAGSKDESSDNKESKGRGEKYEIPNPQGKRYKPIYKYADELTSDDINAMSAEQRKHFFINNPELFKK